MNIVIVGSGIAGVSFAEEFHKLQGEDKVTLLTSEMAGYYSRPLLSHGFTRDDIESRIVLRSFDDLRKSGIAVHSDCKVVSIDRDNRLLSLRHGDQNQTLAYDRLILALGSAALIPPPFTAYSDLFHVLNSFADLVELRALRADIIKTGEQARWGIVGGGLIGCEVASDLAKAGDAVTLFHALPRLMEKQLVPEDSETLRELLMDSQGVAVNLEVNVQGFSRAPDGFLTVHSEPKHYQGFHGVLVACGFKPRIDLAKAAGLATGRGIKVNQLLTTDDPAIHAIGDVAECEDGKIYAYVSPIRSQAIWLARYLAGLEPSPWTVPTFKPKAKVHGFTAAHPYLL